MNEVEVPAICMEAGKAEPEDDAAQYLVPPSIYR
jgi:hypothetical protein